MPRQIISPITDKNTDSGADVFFACSNAFDLAQTLATAIQKAETTDGKYIIGPINSNTWHRYRLVERDYSQESLPAFSAEPYDLDYKDQLAILADFRFTVAARYYSSLFTFESRTHSIADSVADIKQYAHTQSWYMPAIEPGGFARDCDFQTLLAEIYSLSCQAFADNYLYQPISFEEFSKLYQGLKNIIIDFPPVLCRSKSSGELLGYCLILPYLQDTILFKTIARKPGAQFGGIGKAMVQTAISRYLERGYSRGVFALYKDDGSSRYMQDSFGAQIFRSYALFSRQLKTSPQEF
jgi:L-amino acid N-acyltransferase YncA